jgi:phosphate transport system permease protein
MSEQQPTIAREPTRAELVFDRFFRGMTHGFAWLTILLVFLIVWQVGTAAEPAMRQFGWSFLTGKTWDASKGQLGVLPEIVGTLYTSVLGVALGSLFGIAIAIFLTEQYLPPKWEVLLKNLIDLLAAVPSVVYGLWGIFVVIPFIRPAANWVHDHLGWISVFNTRLSGPGVLPAALVLGIMVLPTVTAISRDAIAAVPPKIREAAYGLGATRWEVILGVILPTARRGIWGSIILAFGRALGETMALAMLVGNANNLGWSVFAPSDTLAALLANKFPEASALERQALMYAALVLLAITLAVNVLGTLVTSPPWAAREKHR